MHLYGHNLSQNLSGPKFSFVKPKKNGEKAQKTPLELLAGSPPTPHFKKFGFAWLLVACADGVPRLRVCARATLRSAPH